MIAVSRTALLQLRCLSYTIIYRRATTLEKPLQPLKLNVSKFKAEYNRLSKMSSFQRAMDKAIDIRADKWLSYTPLTKEQLFDVPELDRGITIVTPFSENNIKAPARSSYRTAALFRQSTVFARPTEALAILHAMGLWVLPSDFAVIRQQPNRVERFCILCKCLHSVSSFAPNKRFPSGLSFACKQSLDDVRKGVWRKVG